MSFNVHEKKKAKCKALLFQRTIQKLNYLHTQLGHLI